jgi:hypothetical protein
MYSLFFWVLCTLANKVNNKIGSSHFQVQHAQALIIYTAVLKVYAQQVFS